MLIKNINPEHIDRQINQSDVFDPTIIGFAFINSPPSNQLFSEKSLEFEREKNINNGDFGISLSDMLHESKKLNLVLPPHRNISNDDVGPDDFIGSGGTSGGLALYFSSNFVDGDNVASGGATIE